MVSSASTRIILRIEDEVKLFFVKTFTFLLLLLLLLLIIIIIIIVLIRRVSIWDRESRPSVVFYIRLLLAGSADSILGRYARFEPVFRRFVRA